MQTSNIIQKIKKISPILLIAYFVYYPIWHFLYKNHLRDFWSEGPLGTVDQWSSVAESSFRLLYVLKAILFPLYYIPVLASNVIQFLIDSTILQYFALLLFLVLFGAFFYFVSKKNYKKMLINILVTNIVFFLLGILFGILYAVGMAGG